MKILVIAEKFNVAKKIAYFLSDGKVKTLKFGSVLYFNFTAPPDEYYVVGLKGHIMKLDYPKELNKWDIETVKALIESHPIKIVKYKSVMKVLKMLDKQIDMVIIATDYDREGELIGVEVLENLQTKIFKRAKFSAITKSEIVYAFKHLIDVDFKLSSAAESREQIDLAWGAALTRFLSITAEQKGKNFLSAGRVQSPTLALIVNREKEIKSFTPVPYWLLLAEFTLKITGEHVNNPFKSEPIEIYNKIKLEKHGVVQSIESEQHKIYPPAPFNTTTFLRECTKLGLSVAMAMRVAEDLYMGGYISYPRTDNTVYPKTVNLINVLKILYTSEFAKEAKEIASQHTIIPSRGKILTTDHPPIYPVRAAKKKNLKALHWKVYELVVRRFLATLGGPATILKTNAVVTINSEQFQIRGAKIVQPGWTRYYPYIRIQEHMIPALSVGDVLNVKKIILEKKMTQPPARYTQSTLLKAMEDLNLGTKSTRAEIIEKLFARGYIEGAPIRATNLGLALIEALEKNNVEVVKPNMTKKLEQSMNMIVAGQLQKEEVIKKSTKMLKDIINDLEKKQPMLKDELKRAKRSDVLFGKCPKCGNDLELLKYTKFRFLKCTVCNFTSILPKTGKIQITDKKCPVCGASLIKVLRKGQSVELRCIDVKCEYNRKKDYVGKCPKCGNDLIIRQSKTGKRFVGCTGYPDCTVTYPLPQKGIITATDEYCKECNTPMIIITYGSKTQKQCLDVHCNSHGDNTINKKKS